MTEAKDRIQSPLKTREMIKNMLPWSNRRTNTNVKNLSNIEKITNRMPYVGIGVDLWTRLIQRESLHVQRKSPEMVDPGMIIKIDKQNHMNYSSLW